MKSNENNSNLCYFFSASDRACVYVVSLLECKFQIEKRTHFKVHVHCGIKNLVLFMFCSLCFTRHPWLLCKKQRRTCTILINKDFPCLYITCSEYFISYLPRYFPFYFLKCEGSLNIFVVVFFFQK